MIVRPMTEEVRRFMNEAYQYALSSPDPSTQNGALIVNHGRPRIGGCNGAPKGYDGFAVELTPSRLVSPVKYSYVEHAERAAIYAAASQGVPTRLATMYCPWYACIDCARAIVAAGISTVVGHWQMYMKTPERWRESVDIGIQILEEGGVRHYLADGEIGNENLQLRFNGGVWTP